MDIFKEINKYFEQEEQTQKKYEEESTSLRVMLMDLQEISGQMFMQYEEERMNESTLERAREIRDLIDRIIRILE